MPNSTSTRKKAKGKSPKQDAMQKKVESIKAHNIFLNMNREDKVSLEAEGNDRVCYRFSCYLKKSIKNYHMRRPFGMCRS